MNKRLIESVFILILIIFTVSFIYDFGISLKAWHNDSQNFSIHEENRNLVDSFEKNNIFINSFFLSNIILGGFSFISIKTFSKSKGNISLIFLCLFSMAMAYSGYLHIIGAPVG